MALVVLAPNKRQPKLPVACLALAALAPSERQPKLLVACLALEAPSQAPAAQNQAQKAHAQVSLGFDAWLAFSG